MEYLVVESLVMGLLYYLLGLLLGMTPLAGCLSLWVSIDMDCHFALQGNSIHYTVLKRMFLFYIYGYKWDGHVPVHHMYSGLDWPMDFVILSIYEGYSLI